ncbi:imm11 family protein [Anaeromyxobacter oryzisoli]|uniref:imm11 family protein n=1 Tax=Anaeromyxobacter oryzisoli TaxID=2925408 RepID=UPI001F58BBD8|nr:DUF1629 domain-containing protein [Anaeromyxobacter sp. SG63]
MARVYVPLGGEGFELCQPERQEEFETVYVQIHGTARRQACRPIRMRLVHEDEGKELSTSDSPWLGSHALMFRRSVVERLGTVLEQYGELLPITCSEAELWIFKSTRVLDALDEQASSVLRFSSGRIMRVTRYVFRPEAVSGVEIFKIPNLRVSPTFVSDRFIQLWTSAGLHGSGL